jgi:Pyruvate/2-oxoacid:ferredoxin oxidoreductase delta subunit
MLHLPVFTDVDVSEQRRLAESERLTGFDEVMAGLAERAARHEAQRCLSCGVCFECDNCYAACPEQAIVKLGPGQGYRIDPARCTGCATCFEQCPCHAMEMVPETNFIAPK